MVDPRLIAAVGDLIERHARADRAPVIAIAGSQGSGKSTLSDAAAEAFGAIRVSLDDFYLAKSERQALARDIHPLFETRGPPGTHDVAGLGAAIEALATAGPADRIALPVFDKLTDDRAPESRIWTGRPSAVLVEGWCLGARPQSQAQLVEPINDLERERDPGGAWRRAVNDGLGGPYADLFGRFDGLLFLKAPSFDVVLDWRCEQEEGLLSLEPGALPAARRAELATFIQSYERITRAMLGVGIDADVVVELDVDRTVRHISVSGA